MHRPRKLPDLVESIYDAGLDPSLWNDVVVGIRDFVGGQACGLFSKDSISKFGVTHYYCGADPHYIQLYSETHSKFDPLTVLPPHGQIVSIPDLVNFDEYRRGRFYQEWMRPQGSHDAANVVLEKSNANCPVMMTVLSGRRMVDAGMKHRMSLIVPHASRALLDQSRHQLEADAGDGAGGCPGQSVVRHLPARFLLPCGPCQCEPATRLLAADDVVRIVAGQLVTSGTEANQTLREAFAARGDAASLARTRAMRFRCFRQGRTLCRAYPAAVVGAAERQRAVVRCRRRAAAAQGHASTGSPTAS